MTEEKNINWYSHISALIKKSPRLNVYAANKPAGLLVKESAYAFTYDQETRNDLSREVALGLPFRSSSYASGDLFSVFSMNEPEGYLRFYIEEAMSRAGIPNKLLFLALSQGLQIGRIAYEHPELKLSAPESETLEQLLQERDATYFDRLLARYALRSSLSGAQPKIIVPTKISDDRWEKKSIFTPSVIVKEAGHEFPGLSLNEYFCMTTAARAGLTVPKFWLSADSARFVIERFDRDMNDHPIGFEDMAVLAGLSAKEKYRGSYESIMRITQRYCSDEPISVFKTFERIALSALLKDGDAHLKNFGLLYSSPDASITPSPVYDVVCTAIYPDLDRELALKMNKSRVFPTPDALILFAEKFGIEKEQAMDCIERIEYAIDSTIDELDQDARFNQDSNHTLTKITDVLRPYGLKQIRKQKHYVRPKNQP